MLWEHCFNGWAAGPYGEGDYDHDALVSTGMSND